ncbi:MAG: DUF2442 domain-containing protein [Deltaproteobacteria bacterium]|nr:DUF2442 domain-containing protein [Deltaproteobacteria bacterium]
MYWDVVDAKVVRHLELTVTFADGLRGTVRFLPSHLGGVFRPLKDESFFRQIDFKGGFVSWAGEIDLAPDAMYEAIKQNGEWVLS